MTMRIPKFLRFRKVETGDGSETLVGEGNDSQETKPENKRYRSISREGLSCLISELAPQDGHRLTAANLRTHFVHIMNEDGADFNPAEAYSEYFSTKAPDIFVSYPANLCFLTELPLYLDEFDKWIPPLAVGDKILVSNKRTAVIRYIGPTNFGSGEWVGAELELPTGNHDGSVHGEVTTTHARSMHGCHAECQCDFVGKKQSH